MATPNLEIKNVTLELMEVQRALNVFRENKKPGIRRRSGPGIRH